MDWKKYASLYYLFLIALPTALLNFLILKFLFPAAIYASFHYSVFTLYLLFALASAVILLVLIKIKEKNQEQIGYVFLVVTSVKLVLCYLLLLPVLNKAVIESNSEKINFFMIFILFLAIEVFFTSKLLNNTKQTD